MQVDFYTTAMLQFPEFTRDEIEIFREAFQEFDADHSGAIDKKELAVALKVMGQGVSEKEVDQLFSLVDLDKSGFIEWEEWLLIMRYFYPWRLVEFKFKFLEPAKRFPEFSQIDILTFVSAFREFDLNNSGSIDAYELSIAFKKMGQGCSDAELKQIIAEFDVDLSGEIEWPEFLAIMRSFYPEKLEAYKKKFVEPANHFPEFSRVEIALFVEIFHQFDLNGNGSIDAKELKLVFNAMGQGVTPEEVADLIKKVDKTGKGELDFAQFLQVLRLVYPNRQAEYEKVYLEPAKKFGFSKEEVVALVDGYREFDLDGDGVIDIEELWLAFRTLGLDINKEVALALMAEFDVNKNGVIEWPEFLSMMKKFQGESQSSQETPAQVSSPPPTQKAAEPTSPSTSGWTKATPSKQQPVTKTSSKSGGSVEQSKCAKCGKNVYPMEGPIYALEKAYHKACFKCSQTGCNLVLTIKTYKSVEGSVYCLKHAPIAKPSMSTDSLGVSGAMNAPKVNRVQGVQKNKRMTFAPGRLAPLDINNPPSDQK